MKLTSCPPRRKVQRDITAFSPGSRLPAVLLPCQRNALCISLWMIPVNTLVTSLHRCGRAGCGIVDNRGAR